jgi:hypothetical protein
VPPIFERGEMTTVCVKRLFPEAVAKPPKMRVVIRALNSDRLALRKDSQSVGWNQGVNHESQTVPAVLLSA